MDDVDFKAAVAPTNISAVPKLLSDVASAGDALSKAGDGYFEARKELLAKVRELTRALETPREVMIQHPCNVMAISFGVKSGLWTAMANNGDGPQKVVDLAEQLGLQEELLQRMMRHIAASGYIKMTAPDEYTPNSFSKSLALSVISSAYQTCPLTLNPVFSHAPDWLRDRGYTCPTGSLDTAYQVTHKTKLHFFEHLQSTPPHGQYFNDYMHGYLLGRPEWMDEGFYSVKERLFDHFDTANKDAVLLVDVAGGFGHYTGAFLSKFPDAPGRLILQDLPPVLGQIKQLHPRIERMEYDCFTEQPVKGARAYYTHFVLHDWPDDEAIKIASRTALDLIMMTSFGAKERSAAQWSELLEKKCGLRIVKIWTPINGIESVVECELPE
ncbi:hypothetical protein NUW58_g8625 [Xylaria curta]|uniref:Uncharacterized protein n=1 Tax=Xylaria curta TaxID=42375 RepID=A0ACC1N6L6_9PEZI|nr:hypothetical protein NUW58_g8625 [Xylaria curta]